MQYAPGKKAPYTELSFGRLREVHDQIYFGRWRGGSATDGDLDEARRLLSDFVTLLVTETGGNVRADQGDYLERTLAAFRDSHTQRGSELLLAINNALSYGHRLLNLLLRARGEPNHVSREFATYHEFSDDGDE